MSLPCVYTNCIIVRKESRFRSPHCITVKNPQPFTHSLGTDLNECPLIGYSFKSVPNERPMASQGSVLHLPSKMGATAMVTPLNINFAPTAP